VRRRKADLRGRVNGNLSVEFTGDGLTSYAGLELLVRYLRKVRLNWQIRKHLAGHVPGKDFGVVAFCRVLLGLLIVGGRRLRHIEFLKGDPLFERFCGLRQLPTDRTVSRWLKAFTAKTVVALKALNAEVVAGVVKTCLPARTLTIDVDGTVISTGLKVAWAFRGYNPHHRKVPSYFPISAYLADSGHILRLHNRPGNVNDGSASLTFLRELFTQVQDTLGKAYRLRFRMDGDFFKIKVLRLLEARKAGYTIKVPFWRCLDLQRLIRTCPEWEPVEEGIDGFFTEVSIARWKRSVPIAIFRKRVYHPTRKNYQIDLFDPSDGTWEYSAIATNLSFDTRRLWRFMCGRGVHEKAIGELKDGLALDTVPTNHYAANSAWQQFVVLAHNLLANFQIQTGVSHKPRTQKRTALWVLERVDTLRFELFNKAGLLLHPEGHFVLRLAPNSRVRKRFLRIAHALARAA
jgi:hypothetical protein